MKRCRIMIVEDELILAEDLAISLENAGYIVVGSVSSAGQAIKIALDARPDLILMDVKLNGKPDGLETARCLRTELDIPVVYMTGYSRDFLSSTKDSREECQCLNKPFSEGQLFEIIELVLKNRGRTGE